MQKLTIRQYLALLLMVPVLSATLSLAQLAPGAMRQMGQASLLELGIRVAEGSAALMRDLQTERAAAASLLTATEGRSKHRNRFVEVQDVSDKALEAFSALLADARQDSRLEKGSERLLSAKTRIIDDLKTIREKVFGSSTDMGNMLSAYGGIIDELVAGTSALSAGTANEDILRIRQAFDTLLITNDLLGIERAVGAALINEDGFDDALKERIYVATQLHDRYFAQFQGRADEFVLSLIAKALSPEASETYLQKRRDLVEAVRAGTKIDIPSEDWWALTGKRGEAYQSMLSDTFAKLSALGAQEGIAARNEMIRSFIFQILAVLAGLGLTIMVGMSLSRPIRRASDALERSMRGEADVIPPPQMSERSEIGRISNAVGRFIEATRERQRLVEEREAANAALGETRQRVLMQMEQEFNSAAGAATGTLQMAAATLNEKSVAMLSTMNAVRQAQDEAHGASQQSRAVMDDVARLSSELSRSIVEIAEQSNRTAKLAQEVLGRAEHSRESATRFEEVANAIGEIIGLINAIASQTNLLALNATIEAARAGEAGKGFAVVAGEVKGLAARTVEATRTIESRIDELKIIARRAAEESTHLSDDVGNIQGLNAGIAAAVHQQHATSEGFGDSIRQLMDAVRAVGEQVNTIAALGSDAHASAQSVQEVADEMERTTTTLVETLPRIIAETSQRIAAS
ncbi:MAG: methyl-accepting chemotaxis protein [Proteobacteria bacterium]|nr:methyl-accepting chemotaxis protein [Pseudomonadota bacterium]